MKKLFTIVAAVLMTAALWAQSPEKMSYQAVVRDASDNLVTNTDVGMQISILQGSATGTAVYVETQTPTSNANGLVTIEIGGDDATVVSGDFSAIDWANGPFFLKAETDPEGGTNYTITGTSQLLSVPYAFHAKTVESITEADPVFESWDKSTGISITESQVSDLGDYIETETDPVYDASVASGITGTDTTNWNNKLDSYTETDPEFTSWDKSYNDLTSKPVIIDSINTVIDTTTQFVRNETDPSVPTGAQIGEMQYWNGTAWVTVAATDKDSAILQMISGVPTWVGGTPPPTPNVTNPTTGEIWMDRNLGASQVATSSTDADAYGDLYQWGRAADGHESRTSGTTATLATSDTPGHGDFITTGSSPYDWRSPQNDNLWQGVSGTNNPCPSGYRLPTEAEWDAERASWSSNNAAGAFASPLKLPLAGRRYYSIGSLGNVGSYGNYWSSTASGTGARVLLFYSSSAGMFSRVRADGFSVRCIKD